MPEISLELELKIMDYMKGRLKPNASQRTIRRMIVKKFGDEIKADVQKSLDRRAAIKASRAKWSPVYWIRKIFASKTNTKDLSPNHTL